MTKQKKYTKQFLLDNPKEFDIYMNEIDQGLALKDVQIPNRPLIAISEIGKELNKLKL